MNLLVLAQMVLGLFLIGAILVQVKGNAFGRVWGDSVSFTRRGVEKLVFKLTFVAGALFIVVSIAQIIA